SWLARRLVLSSITTTEEKMTLQELKIHEGARQLRVPPDFILPFNRFWGPLFGNKFLGARAVVRAVFIPLVNQVGFLLLAPYVASPVYQACALAGFSAAILGASIVFGLLHLGSGRAGGRAVNAGLFGGFSLFMFTLGVPLFDARLVFSLTWFLEAMNGV